MVAVGALVFPLSAYVRDARTEMSEAKTEAQADDVFWKYYNLIQGTKYVTTSEYGEALDALQAVRDSWTAPTTGATPTPAAGGDLPWGFPGEEPPDNAVPSGTTRPGIVDFSQVLPFLSQPAGPKTGLSVGLVIGLVGAGLGLGFFFWWLFR